jgi:hypothetical protein
VLIFLNNARGRQGAKGAVHWIWIAGSQAQHLSQPEPFVESDFDSFIWDWINQNA